MANISMTKVVVVLMGVCLGLASALLPASDSEDALLILALDELLADERDWDTLGIEIECRSAGGFHRLELFGNGVGIADRTSQFMLPRDTLRAIVGAFQLHGFAEMELTYGKKTQPEAGRPETKPRVPEATDGQESGKIVEQPADYEPAATLIICRVVLNVDDLHKQVTQLNKGEEYEPLLTLANSVIEMCDEPSQTGTTAASLAIGLSKLRDLELAPETLALIYSDKPARASAGGEGFLLRLDGLDAVTRRYDSTGTIGGNIALRLGDDDIVGLINTLSEKNLDDLPANLYSDRNTSLTVRVLEYRKSIHARNFAGQNNETHGDAQKDFDTIAAALATLHRKILAEGQSTGN